MMLVEIFQILGSIATALAVITALWQSSYYRQKKMKVAYVGDNIGQNVDASGSVIREYIILDLYLTNIGRFDIPICKIELKRQTKIPCTCYGSQINQKIVDFPFNLNVQESIDLHLILDNQISGQIKNRDTLIITDSTNKKYKVRIKK